MNEIEDTQGEIYLPGADAEAERTEMGLEEEDLPDHISGVQVVRPLHFTRWSPSEKCISCQNTRMTEMPNK